MTFEEALEDIVSSLKKLGKVVADLQERIEKLEENK